MVKPEDLLHRLEAVRVNRPLAEAVGLSALNFPSRLANRLVWQSALRVIGLEQ
jgi:hypothetical protein